MQNIQVLNNISPLGLEKFPKDTYKVSTSTDNPDAILVRSAKMHDIEIEKSLKAVGRAGAGVNNIPLQNISNKLTRVVTLTFYGLILARPLKSQILTNFE